MTNTDLGTTMDFEATPDFIAQVEVDLDLLRDFLRFPKDVQIVRVWEVDGKAVLQLRGPGVPANGQLVATYKYRHVTEPTFVGFTAV